MKRFAYKGKTREGKGVHGYIEVENRELAAAKLRQQGYIITSLREAPKSTTLTLLESKGPLKPKYLAIFAAFTMLGTGLSLVNSCSSAEQSLEKRPINSNRHSPGCGGRLITRLGSTKTCFNVVHLVEAGEIAGALPEILIVCSLLRTRMS